MAEPVSVFAIYADYRKERDDMIPYYVVAPSAKVARERFRSIMSWMSVFRIELIADEALIQDIRANRTKYCCFGWYELQKEVP